MSAERYTDAEIAELRDALADITDHFADVMGGPMIAGAGIQFANGVEGIPTIRRARLALAALKRHRTN